MAVNLLVPALTRSRFYREYPEDMDAVVPRVLRQVSAHYDSRCKRTMVEQYFGAYSEFSVTLFEAAVFLDRAGARSCEFHVDEVRTYRCRNGFWWVQMYNCPERSSAKLVALVKTIDSVMRECYDFDSFVKVVA